MKRKLLLVISTCFNINSNINKSLVSILFLSLIINCFNASAQTQNYFGTTGTLNGSVWSTNVGGPYTSPLNTTGGAIINFGNATTTITGAAITVAGINATANATITTIGGTISNFSNGVIPISVSSGKVLDFSTNAFTTSATAGYIKNSAGAIALGGGTYGGGFTLNAGTVLLRGVNAMGGGATNSLTLNGGTVAGTANRDLTGKFTNGITIGGNVQFGDVTANFSQIAANTYNLTFSNNISLGAATRTLTLGNSGTHTLSGTISGTGGIIFAANANGTTGTFALTTGNTYTGKTQLTGGIVSGSGESIFGANPGAFVADQITFNGGTLSATGNIGFSSNRGITFIGTASTINTNANTITLTNVCTGTGGFTKTGTGIILLDGAHTFSGPVTVSAGILRINSTGTYPDASALSVSAGATFDLKGLSETIGSLVGAGTVSSSVTGAITLTTGADNTSTTFSGVAQNGTATSLSINKTGTGTFTLSGANTYTGTTTITNGTLQLGAAERIANTSNMDLNGGTFSTGASTGNSETLGTLNLNANSTIALGTGNHTVTFSNSSGVGWVGTTLTITGWTGTAGSSGTGGKIVVGAGGLTGAQLAKISFTGFPGTPIIVAGEVVPPVTVSVPTLISPTVAAITNTSATLGATITADGGSAITARGTSYKTSSPVIATDNQLAEGGTSIAAYSHNRNSLSPETQYYFVGYATNVNGTAISPESNFRTLSNPPSNQAVNLIASAISSSQIDLSWDAAVFPSIGATTKGYVLIRAVNPLVPTFTATNGTPPTAGVGTIVSSTIIDPTSTFSNTGLSVSTTYNYLLVPYCWDGSNSATYNYLTSAAPTATATTPAGAGCTAPTPQSSAIVFSSVTANSMTISWTAGGGGSSLVLVRAAANISVTPIDGTGYTASTVFGSGDNLGSFTYACYASTGNTFSLTGLSASTIYYVSVFTFNNTGNCYNISSPANSSQATTSAASVIETFEPGTKGTYTNGNAVCNLGNWNFNDALIGTSASDRKNGAKSCRIQNNGTLTMLFDKVNGVGTITVQHAIFGTDASSTWTLDVSDNSGASYTAYQSANITTSTTTLTAQVFTVNVTGDFTRIRITKLSGGASRLNIDDIAMTDYISTNTITTSPITGSPFCISNTNGASVNVPFTSTGAYNSLNVYTAQLSDAAGSFSAPTDIGTLAGNANSGAITSTIPAGTANGSAYRIRVIASDPIITGNANTSNLSVVLNAPDLTNFYGSVTSGTSVILGWTSPASCFDEILIVGKATSTVTASPTGNGSLYTANAAFSTGGSGANLPANEYAVFKAVSGSSVTVTGLTTGTTYFFKAYTRKGTLWSDGVILSITPLNVATGDFQTSGSGTYTTVGIWQTWNGASWVAATAYPNQAGTNGAVPGAVNVTIKSGHTVTLNASRSNQPIKNLVIENGGKIYTNDSTVNGNRYLTIYGDIFCSGIVGNGYNKYDNISFNMEGVNQTISGTGAFNGSRLRKNFNGNTISNLIIAMNIGLKFNSGVSGASGTEIYSNTGGTTFNLTLNENTNLNLLVSTGTSGNISVDGIDGEGSGERGGTFTINGTLSVPGTLFAFTDNVTSPVAYIIGTSGIINCVNVCTGNTASSTTAVQTGSAAGGCTLRILNGGKLNLTGGSSADLNTYNKPFSKRSNTTSPYTYVTGLGINNTTYDFQTGSTVEYSSATGTEPVQSQTLIYSNLLITGGASKTINSTLDVNKDLTIQSPALFDCVNNNIFVGGDWDNYGTIGFTEGTSSTITFDGTAAQHIYCPGGENFYNVTISNASANGVELNCDAELANDLDLGTTGRLFFGATPTILTLTKMTSSSNTFKGSASALVDMSAADHTFIIGCETPGYSGSFNSGTTSLVIYNRDNGISGSGGGQDVLTNINYANLTVTGTDNKRTAGDFTVSANLIVDGATTVLQANASGKTLTLGGNLTLNSLATMDDNCRLNLAIQTSGNALQIFSGNSKTIKCFNLKSTKTAGGISLTLNGTDDTRLNILNDLALDFSSTSVFADNGNTIEVGDDAEIGTSTSVFANFDFTGTLKFVLDGSAVSTDAHLSAYDAINECKAKLNHFTIDPNASSVITEVGVYPTSGTKTIYIKGNVTIANTNALPTQFRPYTNTLDIKGNWSTYAHMGLQATGSKVIFSSTIALQTVSANSDYELFYNLEINNSNGVTINDDVRVANVLTLTNGLINTGSKELYHQNALTTSIVSYGLASYINGNLRRNVNASGTYDFPVGNSANYELATVNLNSQTGMTSILAFFNTTITGPAPSYPTTAINGDGINGLLNSGFWTITPDAYTIVNYNVTLNQRGYSNFSGNANQLGVIKRPNSGSSWAGTNLAGVNGFHNNATQTIAGGTATAKRTSVTAFSDFGIGYSANPLPIQLTTFTATAVNNTAVLLNWETESEINNNYFSVERSATGVSFSEIGIVNGNGTTTSKHNYSLTDQSALSGISYYRVKQVDFDGNFTYSQIRAVEIHAKQIPWSIYPNPVADQLTINCNPAEGFTINVLDILGRIILSQPLNLKSEIINLQSIPSGVYFFELNNGSTIEVKKFVKR